jgi:hypothetical protein
LRGIRHRASRLAWLAGNSLSHRRHGYGVIERQVKSIVAVVKLRSKERRADIQPASDVLGYDRF